MNLNLGIENKKWEKLKDLKVGTLLYSAEIVSPGNVVKPIIRVFLEYVKAPKKADSNSIWARLQECYIGEDKKLHKMIVNKANKEDAPDFKPKSIVQDISVGTFLSYKECLEEFNQMFLEMAKAVDDARIYECNSHEIELASMGDDFEVQITFERKENKKDIDKE